jgi:hypothetical protein
MRTREQKSAHFVIGSKVSSWGHAPTPVIESKSYELKNSSLCLDSTTPHPHVIANDLLIDHVKESSIVLNGQVENYFLGSFVHRCKYRGYPLQKLTASLAAQDILPLSTYVTRAVERASPHKPSIDSIEALVGLPHLAKSIAALNGAVTAIGAGKKPVAVALRELRSLGKGSTVRGAASVYLGYTFGIAPLVRDVQEVLSLQESIAKSAKRFRDLQLGKVRYRGTLDRDSWKTKKAYTFLSSAYTSSTYHVEETHDSEVWFSLTFKDQPESLFPERVTRPYGTMGALRQLGAFNPEITAWNLIPWSFLVDYFLDIGSLISTYRAPPVKEICIMREVKVALKALEKVDSSGIGLYYSNADLSVRPRRATLHRKERKVFYTSIGVPIKFSLSRGQSLTLAALTAQRRRLIS